MQLYGRVHTNSRAIILFLPYLTDRRKKPIGLFSQQHLRYLKEHCKIAYINLLISGRKNLAAIHLISFIIRVTVICLIPYPLPYYQKWYVQSHHNRNPQKPTSYSLNYIHCLQLQSSI